MTLLEQLAAELNMNPVTLATRLQTVGISEQASPNYQTVDPSTGAVGALFTGGLQLVESSGFVESSAISWIDATGVVRELVLGEPGGFNQHQLTLASASDAQDIAQILCKTTAAGALGSASVVISVQDDHAGGAVKTLLDSSGHSDWVLA